MARFTYRCPNCGHEQEVQHKIGMTQEIPCLLCTQMDPPHVFMQSKPVFTPTLYSSSPAFYKNGGIKTFPKAGPR